MIQDKKITKGQVRQLFEYFNPKITQQGEKPSYSAFIFNNVMLLAQAYNSILRELYDPNTDQEAIELQKENSSIIYKYIDRNEQGEPVFDNNKTPVITENLVEYQEAMKQFNEINAEKIANINKKQAHNVEIYNEVIDIKLDCLGISEFINEAPPFVVGLCKI